MDAECRGGSEIVQQAGCKVVECHATSGGVLMDKETFKQSTDDLYLEQDERKIRWA